MRAYRFRISSRTLLVAALLIGLGGAGVLNPPVAHAAPAGQQSVLARVVDTHLTWYVRQPDGSGGFTTQSFTFGLADDKPLLADWDGNGTHTPGVVRGSTWYLRNGSGGGAHDVAPFTFGRATDRFVTGDWDGDGTFTPGVYRGGTWFLRNANSGGLHDVTFAFGAATDVPVTGDWDGNGTFTAGVVRGTSWQLRNAHSAGTPSIQFGYGVTGDKPITGDWDGDGTWTPGVIRSNVWMLRMSNSSGDADAQFSWGRNSDAQLYSGVAPPVAAVTPVDWARFTVAAPADADAARLASILSNTNRYANLTWWSSKGFAAQTGTYLDFGGNGELNIRGPAHEAYALAVSLRTGVYDPAVAGVPAAEARARAGKLIRSLAMRHLVNTDNGWGAHWQSALWTSFAAMAGWLLWEDLSTVDRARVARMLEYEADRFNNYPVPYLRDRAGVPNGSEGDTKAEENAWNAQVLQVATAMMPEHRRYPGWMRKAAELEISAFSRPADVTAATVVNGRAVGQWLNGSNINNDGVVVNHNRAHPDYSTTVSENIHAALAYSMGWQPTPRAAFWGAQHVYAALVDKVWVAGTAYPPGGTVQSPGGTIYVRDSEHMYYPQGNDWGTTRRIQPTLLDVQAHAFGFDSLASRKGDYWQRLHGDKVLQMQQRSADRRTYVAAAEDVYGGREELVAVTAAQAWLTRWVITQGAFSITDRPL